MLETAIIEAPMLDGGNEVWIEALPAKIFHTPQYGPVPVSPDKLRRMVQNFNNQVRGQEIATDFDHGMDRAKGNQASGWYRELAIRPSSEDPSLPALYARVELTNDAAKELSEKKWKYFSLEWDDEWIDNEGRFWTDVVCGGGLTNRPIAKKTMPINFSEALWDTLDYETKKEFAVWPSSLVNSLPDISFLYVEPESGLRYFPYRDKDGVVDLPHLRNAIARIPHTLALSEAVRAALQGHARHVLSETMTLPTTSESKEWEHSAPGTGSPPQPRTDEDGSDDIAIKEGWRVDTPAIERDEPNREASVRTSEGDGSGNTATVILDGTEITTATSGAESGTTTNIYYEGTQEINEEEVNTMTSKGGKVEATLTNEQEFELRNILGIDAKGDVVEAARLQLGELTELRRSVDAVSQEKKFAEEYPAYWAEHNKLMERDRTTSAKLFSESVQRVRKAEGFGLKETAMGLSSMSLQKVMELHKSFSEGTATLEQYEDTIRTITNGGIVAFGEVGTTNGDGDEVPLFDTTTAGGVASARRAFAEVIVKIQRENPEMDYKVAMGEAARKHPDLAEAYNVALPA